MSVTINGVTVKLDRDPEDWRRYRVTIQVKSPTRPGLKGEQYIDPGKAVSTQQLIKGIGAAAAVCAEYLATRYGDHLDPSTCIRDAITAFGEECRLIAELSKDIDKKLDRLWKSSILSSKERDVLTRMLYLNGKGEKLTRQEGEWVNEKIAQLHSANL